MKRIILVFPAAESRRPVSLDRNFPPMGITKIATALKQRSPEIEVMLVDEAYERMPEVKKGDVVGISCTALNSRRSADLAKLAGRSGAHVILGGPHATNRAKQALAEIPEVHQVVRNHGEDAFADIIFNGNKKRIINGMLYCSGLPIPLPDLNLWKSLAPYEQVFDRSEWSRDYVDGFFLETQRGCSQSPRCSYCVRGPAGMRKITPSTFWDSVTEIRGARLDGLESERIPPRKLTISPSRGGRRLYSENKGKMLVFDFSDEFMAMGSSRMENLNELACAMPPGIREKVEFLAYARPDQIDSPDIADLMKEIGISRVSLGIESGDPEMLARMRRGMGLQDHKRAVQLLAERGIMIYPNFLLGGFEETLESMRRTIEHFKEIVELAEGMVYRTGARIVVPFPGSLDFRRLMNKLCDKGKKAKAEMYNEAFVMEPAMLESDWLDNCTHVLMDDILDAHEEIMEFARKKKIGISDRPHLS